MRERELLLEEEEEEEEKEKKEVRKHKGILAMSLVR
jgi:hypothetical protein